ncbi:MAG TPA: hypothetical protein VK550_03770 [Polyangiaceae bacterium]|nr:hypothetical protein [Polyangiaceae bacterium]
MRWTGKVTVLAALAVAAANCRGSEDPVTATNDGGMIPDVVQTSDVIVSSDASADGRGDEQLPEVDSASNDGAVNDGAVISAPDAIDASDDLPHDAGEASLDIVTDIGIGDVAADFAPPPDGSVEGGDGASVDAPAGNSDVDAGVPDVDGPIDPIFRACAYMPSLQITPAAIIDALPGEGGLGSCHCTGSFTARTYRVLCGSYSPPLAVRYTACSTPPSAFGHELFILENVGCPVDYDAGSTMWVRDHRPLSDWDTLLNEQSAGHTDSGPHD